MEAPRDRARPFPLPPHGADDKTFYCLPSLVCSVDGCADLAATPRLPRVRCRSSVCSTRRPPRLTCRLCGACVPESRLTSLSPCQGLSRHEGGDLRLLLHHRRRRVHACTDCIFEARGHSRAFTPLPPVCDADSQSPLLLTTAATRTHPQAGQGGDAPFRDRARGRPDCPVRVRRGRVPGKLARRSVGIPRASSGDGDRRGGAGGCAAGVRHRPLFRGRPPRASDRVAGDERRCARRPCDGTGFVASKLFKVRVCLSLGRGAQGSVSSLGRPSGAF